MHGEHSNKEKSINFRQFACIAGCMRNFKLAQNEDAEFLNFGQNSLFCSNVQQQRKFISALKECEAEYLGLLKASTLYNFRKSKNPYFNIQKFKPHIFFDIQIKLTLVSRIQLE